MTYLNLTKLIDTQITTIINFRPVQADMTERYITTAGNIINDIKWYHIIVYLLLLPLTHLIFVGLILIFDKKK